MLGAVVPGLLVAPGLRAALQARLGVVILVTLVELADFNTPTPIHGVLLGTHGVGKRITHFNSLIVQGVSKFSGNIVPDRRSEVTFLADDRDMCFVLESSAVGVMCD